MLEVEADRGRLARYGMNAEDVLAADTCPTRRPWREASNEGRRRFDLRALLPPADEGSEGFRRLPVGSFEGQVAQVREVDGPAQVSRQGMQRRLRIEVNIRGRDLVSFVEEARATVSRDVPLAAGSGYRLEWGGQFENFERATARLAIVLPLSLAIIFGMLFLTFGNVRYAIAVFSGVPFALIGGVLALEHAVTEGSVSVLRAVLLTATVAAIGFLPMAISSSAGSEVQRPLATAVIGGVVSSTLLGLFVLPGLLRIFLGGGQEAKESAPASVELSGSPAE